MPRVVPTGVFGKTLQTARLSLANVAAFRNWIGVAAPSGALGRIALWQETFAKLTRPYALIHWGPKARREWSGHGAAAEFHPWAKGTVVVRFVAEAIKLYDNDPGSGLIDFMNRAEASMEGMADLSGTASNLVFSAYEPPEEPEVYMTEDGNPFDGFAANFEIELPDQ
jgi:hypothetical protein